jgi:hypothetical protein
VSKTKKKRKERRFKYYATGVSTQVCAEFENGYFIEFNPNCKMYRINHPKGVPLDLMGYNPHINPLVSKVIRK